MRVLLLIVLLIVGLLGGLWLGGESWLAGRATAAIDQRKDLAAAAVVPLREMRRIGLRVDQLDYQGKIGGAPADLQLPWLEAWVSPTSPVEVHATLPDQARLVLKGAEIEAQMQAAEASLRVSPTNGMAVSRVGLTADAVALAGQPLLQAVSVAARLVSMGHDAPSGAGAAYDVDLRLDGLEPATLAALGLPPLVLPGRVGLAGEARVWLTSAPGRGMLQGGSEKARPVGFRSEGMVLSIGDLQARLVGQVTVDDTGRPTGRLALYSDDGQAWLAAISDAGLMPPAGVALGGAMLRGLSQIPMDLPQQADASAAPAVSPRAGFTFPEAAEGETRLPLFLRDGKLFLGVLPIARLPVLGQG